MALPENYLLTTKNIESFFNALITAQAPKQFTQKFLEQLEFRSTNDRLFIGLLKSLEFLDANGAPTEKYFEFLDQTQSKEVLAKAIREAYSDLFMINKEAYKLDVVEVKNKLRTLTQGSKSDKVVGLMANTFKGLAEYAEWKSILPDKKIEEPKKQKLQIEEPRKEKKDSSIPELHYNIQIHLPESRDPSVYDALFRSLKEHLF